jgi:molybdopterin molybdotransferase
MITYPEAISLITHELRPVAAQRCRPGAAPGAGLAEAVRSRLDVPDFDNAAMDGIAVRAADVAAATPATPATLRVVGIAPAGRRSEVRVGPGEALEIMTGAPLPAGADTVIPVEGLEWHEAAGEPRRARVQAPVETGRNVRRAGEDFRQDALLLDAGAALTPHAVMNLAAGGVDEVLARPRASVAAVTTGSELADQGAPSGTGQIRDANGPYLAAAMAAMGGELAGLHAAPDLPDAVAGKIRLAARQAQLVLTTGGVSAGRLDCVPAAVQAAGGEILFHKVAIRPGKPVLFARLPDERWLFGLPGNPVAVAVGLRFFVAPALRRLRGLQDERLLPAVITRPLRKRSGLRFFGKAIAKVSESGRLEVELLPGQESFKVRPLLDANCWLVVPEERDEVAAGETVEIVPLYPTDFLQPG